MPEGIKEKIHKFLKENEGKEFSISKVKEEVKHSYQTVLKWTIVLEAEGRIKIKDYGNIKLASYVEE